MRYITKQAYINGLAARGVLRNRVMQKMADGDGEWGETKTDSAIRSMGETPTPSVPTYSQEAEAATEEESTPMSKDEIEKETAKQRNRLWYLSKRLAQPGSGYLTPGLIGTGIGGIVGALVQAARQKNILLGAGIGAGMGGLAGIGGKYINDKHIYPKILDAYNESPIRLSDTDAPDRPYTEYIA